MPVFVRSARRGRSPVCAPPAVAVGKEVRSGQVDDVTGSRLGSRDGGLLRSASTALSLRDKAAGDREEGKRGYEHPAV